MFFMDQLNYYLTSIGPQPRVAGRIGIKDRSLRRCGASLRVASCRLACCRASSLFTPVTNILGRSKGGWEGGA